MLGGPLADQWGGIRRVKSWSGTDSTVGENTVTEALESPFACKVLASPP